MYNERTLVVWDTKYALTKGISQIEVVVPAALSGFPPNYLSLRESGACIQSRYLGKDCFADKDQALIACRKLRDAKIKSLKKQIAKLEAMAFEETEA